MPKTSHANRDGMLDRGTISFTIESRILRELGERLVKQPEVAIVELIKNSYDADAIECSVEYDPPRSIVVSDNGAGMTLDRFTNGWMRIGTSAKEDMQFSDVYSRMITGEKGIGRFAVRFLGRALSLVSVADDEERGIRTRLTATFDWPKFDRHEDLGKVQVPYELVEVSGDTPTGTTLTITRLRTEASRLDLNTVRTGSIGILTPLRSLFRAMTDGDDIDVVDEEGLLTDPGFLLKVRVGDDEDEGDVAASILDAYVLRARLRLQGDKIDLRIYRRGLKSPYLKIVDTYPNEIGKLYADLRFFPRRTGTFTNMPVDGRRAQSWVGANHGVAVFDRSFRVQPYGSQADDWLRLQADAARNHRDPRSTIAGKHFAMSPQVRADTSQNWMLRLPQSAQLVGLVQVEGKRSNELDPEGDEEGLIASADREGFVENLAFTQLSDLVRGAVEAIAFADRRLQQEEKQAEQEALVASIRDRTQTAISEVQRNPNIAAADKVKIVAAIAQTQQYVERREEDAREREQQLEVMSLLGVVAGFMTHEFGVALQELESTQKELVELAKSSSKFLPQVESFAGHIRQLKEFVTYSSGYIQGSRAAPAKPYPVRPRLQQVKRVFGKYAEERNIDVEISAEIDLAAAHVPVSLYNGIALNLYTNALKAVTAKVGKQRGKIAFRAWNEGKWHYLEVSDTGVGIPNALQDRVFDPLFTTTQSKNDPLGSGMGLGLALVRRGAEAFGGRAELVEPPADFSTCVRVRLPLSVGVRR
ncbi:sensor histidine kinase [Sphingomonas carotinifaciens]|uniref:sensor histidine kinase n=1 Tax=Sphingomonas carotinifaciens TaxID=1166323 RepID=UPI0039A3BA64